MLTPDEMIENVLADLARPDLQGRAVAKFVQSVRAVHSIEFFRQDLAQFFITDPEPNSDGVVHFITSDVLPRFRRVEDIHLYQNYMMNQDEVIPQMEIPLPGEGYKDGVNKLRIKDYFGFVYPFTYSILGARGSISGVSKSVKAIGIEAAIYPEVLVDEVSGALSTESWILRERPELIEAQLKWELSKITQNRDAKRNAEETIMFERENFISQHLNDILEG